MVPEYPSNSNKSKEEQKGRATPVIEAPPQIRKKKENKYLKVLIANDFKDIKGELMKQYVEPKAKELFWGFIQAQIDFVTNALRMMVFQNYKPTNQTKLPAERYSYARSYSSPTRPQPTMTTEINYDEFLYNTYGLARAVLDGLKERLAGEYRVATVLDLYDLSNVPTTNHALQNYGWKNLDFAEIQETTAIDPETGIEEIKYIISLPKPTPVK